MAKDRILSTISLTSSSETLSVNEKLLIDHLDEEAEQLETTELMAGFELSIADVAFMPVLVKLQISCSRLHIATEVDKCYCPVRVQCCSNILVQQILASSVNPRFTRFGVAPVASFACNTESERVVRVTQFFGDMHINMFRRDKVKIARNMSGVGILILSRLHSDTEYKC